MKHNVLTSLLVGLLTVVGVSSVWAGVESWSFTNQYQRRAWPRSAHTASNISFNNGEWNNLSDWGGDIISNNFVTGDHGDKHGGTAFGNSAEISILIYKHTKNIPAYSKYVRTATFYMYYKSNFFAHGFGLYLFDDESTAKSTALDVSLEKNQSYGNAYLIRKGWSADYHGNTGNINGSKTITYDNSTGSAAKDISKYIDLTHTTTDGDHVETNKGEWVTWKETASSNETWYYYKYFTFKANDGIGTAMAVQSIENSGNLTANTYTREGYLFAGWNTAADGTGTAYTDGQAITATSSDKGEITLYAQWKQNIVSDGSDTQDVEEAKAAVNNTISEWKTACETQSTTIVLTIARTIYKDGYFNTLCLPFDMTTAQIAATFGEAPKELKQFVSASVQGTGDDREIIIETKDTTGIKAGRAYLISFEQGTDLTQLIFSGVSVTKTAADEQSGDLNYQGILAPKQLPSDESYLFLGDKNRLYWPIADGTFLKGFRAYFQVTTAGPSAPYKRGMKASFGKTVPTANDNVNVNDNEVRKLVEEGRVVIKTNGVKYDMNGRKIVD